MTPSVSGRRGRRTASTHPQGAKPPLHLFASAPRSQHAKFARATRADRIELMIETGRSSNDDYPSSSSPCGASWQLVCPWGRGAASL
jgi:hypothetical protein